MVVTSPAVLSPPPSDAYPGQGFVVHEWGTNTVMVGSDGVLLRGLQHEGDDLPGFVFDRLKQGELLAFPTLDKMETPVDYFYSDVPRTVSVRIDMPNGVLTQWYPAVTGFSPPIFNASHGPELYVDPVSAVHYEYSTDICKAKYPQLSPGMLDWGNVEILARDAQVTLPEAALDRYTWSYARQVAANAVRVQNPMGRRQDGTILREAQSERYLFYRGLGRFEPPVRVTSFASGEMGAQSVRVERSMPSSGPVWLLHVDTGLGAFVRLDPAEGQSSFESRVPELNRAHILDTFVEELAAELTAALRGTGLYQDEALAMVNTWRNQWFRTPGVRVLYFAPASWLARELPLTITPAPDQTTRVMVMRVEVLTPSVEDADVAAAIQIGAPETAATTRDYFHALGRFAEPRLRRARALLGGRAPVEIDSLLKEIEGPNVMSALGE